MKSGINMLLLVIGCCILQSTSCPKLHNHEDMILSTAVQFYVDQAKYNQGGSGRVITSITINGTDYTPKNFIDQCTEGHLPSTTASTNGNPYFRYKINMKNYKSLDAMMNGLPFSWEYWEGIIYFSDLKEGCNTLEVAESVGTQLFRLAIK